MPTWTQLAEIIGYCYLSLEIFTAGPSTENFPLQLSSSVCKVLVVPQVYHNLHSFLQRPLKLLT